MHEAPSDHFTVTPVMLREKSQHKWGEDLWTLRGVLPGLTKGEIKQAELQGTLFFCFDLVIQLYPLHCAAYYQNLISEQPKIYLVCNANESESPQPLLMTVDYDEAAAYMETGEQVFHAALADVLCVWLERFVLAHYRPKKPKKRQREHWHESEQRT
jgi:hypothetical protein